VTSAAGVSNDPRASHVSRVGRAFRGWRDPLALIAIVLAAWQLLYWYAGGVALTSPAATFAQLGSMLQNPRFLPHVTETLAAFAQGFAIAVLLGLAIGVTLGAHRLTGEVAEPILVALYSIPKVTLYPVILLIFGIGMPAKVAFGAIQGIVPVSLFALNAIRNIKPVYTRTARMLRLPPARLVAHVILPAALPEIVTGIRVGFSLTLIGTLLGEMFGAQRGLGFLLLQAMTLHNMKTIMAVTLRLVIAAATVNAVLLGFERRLRERM
jgi:NitT/TauT family transport system permease protein